MLKRIPVERLTVGMFIHELCGSWLDHPFWRGAFTIENAKYLKRIVDSGLHEAWIDTERGLDVAGGISQEESDAEVERDLIRSATEPVRIERVGAEQEVARAAKIATSSTLAVAALFREARMGKAIHTEDVLPVVNEIMDSVLRNPGVLTALTRLRRLDDYTYLHSVSVCALMIALGKQLGLDDDQLRETGLAGLLHDIGKVRIAVDLLNKKSHLTDEEFAELRRHAEMGHEILAGSGGSDVVLDVCLHHHERVDGTGYPKHLNGDAISLHARIATVCDVYDATTSNRPYKEAWQPAHALRKMTEWSAGHFDLRVFHAFVRTVGIYPLGTLVRLKSRRLGVVVDQSAGSLLAPRVKIFYSIAARQRLTPKVIDLSQPEANDEIVSHEDPGVWAVDDLTFLWSGIAALPE